MPSNDVNSFEESNIPRLQLNSVTAAITKNKVTKITAIIFFLIINFSIVPLILFC